MPSSLANLLACLSSESVYVSETAVTANTFFFGRASLATFNRKLLSTPPEKAMTMLFNFNKICFSFSILFIWNLTLYKNFIYPSPAQHIFPIIKHCCLAWGNCTLRLFKFNFYFIFSDTLQGRLRFFMIIPYLHQSLFWF